MSKKRQKSPTFTTNLLLDTWKRTNLSNWDAMEAVIRKAQREINSGRFDKKLLETYMAIDEALTSLLERNGIERTNK